MIKASHFWCIKCNNLFPKEEHFKHCSCKSCSRDEIEKIEKQRIAKKNLRAALKEKNVDNFRSCRLCNQVKTRVLYKRLDRSRSLYVDDTGRIWDGKVCPDCKKEYYRTKRKLKPIITKSCKICNKSFPTNNKRQVFCSTRCRADSINLKNKKLRQSKPKKMTICPSCLVEFNSHNKQIYCSPKCKPSKIKLPRFYKKVCTHCGNEYETRYKNSNYCKPSHRPSAIKSRNELKRIKKFKQPISKFFREEINKFYDNKPAGFEVDHIIPRNHPLVCGLHVPANLQYLSREDNNKKNGHWDGTIENESWKLIKK